MRFIALVSIGLEMFKITYYTFVFCENSYMGLLLGIKIFKIIIIKKPFFLYKNHVLLISNVDLISKISFILTWVAH
jgi:hypothetical protein